MNTKSLVLFIESIAVAILFTGLSIVLSTELGLIETVDPWEAAATAASFSCVYMCVKQTRWNYPMAVVSTALLSYVFWKAELYGSMALNIYLIPTVIYGYFIWGKDDNPRPVQNVKVKALIQYVIATAVAYAGALVVIDYFGGSFAPLDSLLLIGSIFAQFLLDRKKIETWFVWIAVNVVSIYVYYQSGLYLLSIQFFLFLLNAFYGYYSWRKSLANN